MVVVALVKSPFAIIPWEVASDRRLTSRHLRVLIALLSFRSQDTGPFWATRQQISERCGLRLTRISEVTTELEGMGWLKKIGSGHVATRYLFSVPTVPELGTVPNLGTVPESGTVTVPKLGTQQSLPPGTLLDPPDTHSETLRAFGDFWKLYPIEAKGSKQEALREWNKIKPDSAISTAILIALQNQIDERVRAEPGAFVANWKHACRWLKYKCWMNEPTEYKAEGKSNEAPKRLSAVDRVRQRTAERAAQRAIDGRTLAEDGSDIRPQMGKLLR